jgi:uncharacterized protein YPO0396
MRQSQIKQQQLRLVEPDDAGLKVDPRAAAFAELIRAVDRADWRAGQLATRKLKALGFSVCLLKPLPEEGRR